MPMAHPLRGPWAATRRQDLNFGTAFLVLPIEEGFSDGFLASAPHHG